VPLENGVLDISQTNPELKPYSPDYYFTSKLPVRYDPKAKCPNFLEFLGEVVPSQQSRDQIQELFGYFLKRNYRYQVAFILIGDGWNGKSTLIGVMIAFLGKANISSVSLEDLNDNRFASASLYGKYANLKAEFSSSALENTGTFKMLTGGDLITAERKYHQSFEFTNYAKLVFAVNKVPYTNDSSIAYFRRWIRVTFPNKFSPELGNCNPRILEEITTQEELSGILNWALEGLARLEKNGCFSHMSTDEQNRDGYLRLSSSLYAFIKDQVTENVDTQVTKEDFYKAYARYCQEQERELLSKNAVSRVISRFLPSIGETRPKIGENNRQVYCWSGIKVIGANCYPRGLGEEEFED
jgi:putative DNA primase/helicase